MFDLFVDFDDKESLDSLIWMLECDGSLNHLRKFIQLSHRVNKQFLNEYIERVGMGGLRFDLGRFYSEANWDNIFVYIPTSCDPDIRIPINASQYQKLVLEKLHSFGN